jgi:hypothetical protein
MRFPALMRALRPAFSAVGADAAHACRTKQGALYHMLSNNAIVFFKKTANSVIFPYKSRIFCRLPEKKPIFFRKHREILFFSRKISKFLPEQK